MMPHNEAKCSCGVGLEQNQDLCDDCQREYDQDMRDLADLEQEDECTDTE